MTCLAISPAHEMSSFTNCRVLVVEDDEICQDIMLLMLDRLGYHADVVNDGVDAVSAMHAAPYDVVLMDVRMPRMDGMEAARLIRAQTDPIDQPTIVAMTADTTPQCQEECLQAGMDGHMGKPVRIGDLAAALENRSLRQWKLQALDPYERDARPVVVPIASLPAVFDVQVLESLLADLGAEESVGAELIESFIHDCKERLISVVAAGETGDLGALAFEAHAIKSASATIGLMALSDLARGIEAMAKATSGDVDASSQASLLAAECHRAIDVLNAEPLGGLG